jgi:hypothetical protein
MRGICVHEQEHSLRPDWVDKLSHLEEQAGSKVSVVVIRANDLKLAANNQVSKKVFRQPRSVRDIATRLLLQVLVVCHEAPFPPIPDACHSEQHSAGEKKYRPQLTRPPVTNA